MFLVWFWLWILVSKLFGLDTEEYPKSWTWLANRKRLPFIFKLKTSFFSDGETDFDFAKIKNDTQEKADMKQKFESLRDKSGGSQLIKDCDLSRHKRLPSKCF